MEWPGRVSRHDLVYLSPPDDPMTGLIIGNGEVGTLCYVSGSKIFLVVNRSDLWDDAEFGVFGSGALDEEEHHTTLRHGGRIIIDFKVPVFDLIYLSDFQGRLSLAEGRLELHASGPFGAVTLSAFVCYDRNILICNIENRLSDVTIPVEIVVERFGSRMFHRWYSQVNPDAALGLAGTVAHVTGNGGCITHTLTSGRFALGCSVRGLNGFGPEFATEGQNRVKCSVSADEAPTFELVCGITEPMTDDPIAAVEKLIDGDVGMTELLEMNRTGWKSFWLRSLMESGDDFLDNLWHLTMYYSNASQRGKYPGRFCGLLWNWQHDFQAWGFYFHFNQQQIYWPLNAAGHHDLITAYLNMRFNGLVHAKEDAECIFGVQGAVVSDVSERRGYNSKSEFHNHTPAAQIAMEFWRQYQYTGDRAFLREQALPYMTEAALFFATLFEKAPDGTYHARGGSGYEGGPLLRDVVSEIVTAHVLFPAVLEAMHIAGTTHPESAKWRQISENLPTIATVEQPRDVIENTDDGFVLQKGFFKRGKVPVNKSFAAGWGIDEQRLMTSFSPVLDPEYAVHAHPMWLLKGLMPRLIKNEAFPSTYGQVDMEAWHSIRPDTNVYNDKIFPGVELSAVYPSGYIGLSQRDTEEFSVAITTAKMFSNDTHGWIPFAPILARLGLGAEASRILEEIYEREPVQVNGTVVDSSGLAGEYAGPEAPLELRSSLARYTDREGRFPNQTKSFRFFSIYSGIANGMNEMLLQSHDKIIRVGPAVDKRRSARFTLHAVGGFAVSSEIEKGKIRWIVIESLRGETCTLENPWPNSALFRNDVFVSDNSHKLIVIDTQVDDLILVLPERGMYDTWETTPIRHDSNRREKRCHIGKNMLGMARTF